MPDCKKCGEFFSQIFVDDNGKSHPSYRRTCCFKCSPFGYKAEVPTDNYSICTTCGRKYIYDKNKLHSRTRCNSCVVSCRRHTIKKRAIEYKGGKCQLCGYDKCDRALGFHHRDRKEKSFNISGGFSRSWDNIRKELDKCDLLCANCHCEVHSVEDNAHKLEWTPREKNINNKICPYCKKEFKAHNKKIIHCSRSCANYNRYNTVLPTKEELIELIPNMTLSKIGEKYDMSTRSIKIVMKKYGLME